MKKDNLSLSVWLVAIMLLLFIFIFFSQISNTILAQTQLSTNNQSYHFVGYWGLFGTEKGQFYGRLDITIDSLVNVYVADSMNNRIQKFDSNGHFITQWGFSGPLNGQFINPSGIAFNLYNNAYVADTGNDRIDIFALDSFNNTKINQTLTPYLKNNTSVENNQSNNKLSTCAFKQNCANSIEVHPFSINATNNTNTISKGYTQAPFILPLK